MDLSEQQRLTAQRFGATTRSCDPEELAGVARDVAPGSTVLNALRHPPENGTCGWYVWAGEWSDADDFFDPLHVRHLADRCPTLLPYLGLAQGWRVLLAPGHEDVWFDATLLDI